MNDKKSDPFLVYALIASYRNLLSTNSKYFKLRVFFNVAEIFVEFHIYSPYFGILDKNF